MNELKEDLLNAYNDFKSNKAAYFATSLSLIVIVLIWSYYISDFLSMSDKLLSKIGLSKQDIELSMKENENKRNIQSEILLINDKEINKLEANLCRKKEEANKIASGFIESPLKGFISEYNIDDCFKVYHQEGIYNQNIKE